MLVNNDARKCGLFPKVIEETRIGGQYSYTNELRF